MISVLVIHIALILTSVFSPMLSSEKTDDCKELLRSCINKIALNQQPKGNKVYFIDFSIESEGRNNSAYDTKIETKAYIGSHGKMYFESNIMNAYMDSTAIYTVIHPQKLIVKSNPEQDKNRKMRQQKLQIMQDSLLELSKVKTCVNGVYSNINVKVITLVPTAKGRKKLNFEQIIFYYNEKTDQIEGQDVYFLESSPIVKQHIRYNKLDFNYTAKLKNKASDYIFEGGKLKPSFRNYKFEDNTKQ